MTNKRLKKELKKRRPPTDGRKAALVERPQDAMQKTLTEAFRTHTKQASDAAAGVAAEEKEAAEAALRLAQQDAKRKAKREKQKERDAKRKSAA